MLWIKAFHIMAVICWFSAIFYLPRLFVYHAMSEDQVSKDRFTIMESKLFWGIMTPSAVVTVALGIWLITGSPDYYLSAPWMQVKLALIVLLLAYHTVCWVFLEKLKTDSTVRSHRYFRVFNEIPIFMMVPIVILVVVKPVFGA